MFPLVAEMVDGRTEIVDSYPYGFLNGLTHFYGDCHPRASAFFLQFDGMRKSKVFLSANASQLRKLLPYAKEDEVDENYLCRH